MLFETSAFMKEQKLNKQICEKYPISPRKNPSNLLEGINEVQIIEAPVAQRDKTHVAEGDKPILTITVAGKQVTALLDTGSSVSLINQEWFGKYKRRAVMERHVRVNLIQACGNAEIKGAARLKISWNDGNRRQRFLIVPNLSHTVILGRDFLAQEDFILHTKKNGWSSGDNPEHVIPYSKEIDVIEGYSVNALETDTLPIPLENQVNHTNCNHSEKNELRQVLSEYKHLFTTVPGLTNNVIHEINTGSAKPVRSNPRPMSHRKRQLFDQAFDKLLENGLIEASESAWSNPTVLVENEGKEPRLCLDARKLNDVTEADSYPMPSIPEIIGHLGDAQYFTVLDLSKGYLQIRLSDTDKEKTAFGSHRGFFHYTRMCFGLRNAPATFQRFIDKTLGEMKWKCCLPYLDDIVIFSRTFQEHSMHLRQVLAKLEAAQVTINPQKVQLCCPEVQLLGFVVRPGSCSPSPKKMAALRNFPSPTKVLELQQVLGMVNYYRHHVPNFANKAIPLYQLLKKKVRWDWSSECENALRGLLRDLEANAELKLPDLNKKFIIQTDASAFAIAAVLMQDTEQGLKPVSFISRALTSAERNYTTMEREGLAAIYALRKFRMYIECTRFEIQTDNMSLSWIKGLKDPTGRLARWALELSALDCVITHIPGKKNTVADTFSRIELKPDIDEDEVECAVAALQPVSQIIAGLPVTRKTLIEEQNKDPSLSKWFAMCRGQLVSGVDSETGTTPVNHQGGRYSVEDDGLLLAYFASEDETDEEAHGDWKIVMPKSLRAQVIDYFHSSLLAGHLAVRKTVKRLCQRVTWRGLTRDVRKFVKTCDTCQKSKATNQKPAGLMKSVESSRPFEKITFDTMGPYPMSNGAQYLLVICDHFTKWIEVFPLRKLSTVNVWQPLRQWFTRFGYPREMICDNASVHRSKLHMKLCNELGIKTHYISSYHAQANPSERYIRSFKQMIVSFTSQHKDWAKYTPELAFALRTAVNETTGYSPAFLTFGRELKFPIDWEWNRPEPPIHSHKDYANRMQATLRTALELAKSTTKKSQAKQKKYYDRTRRNVEFEPGMLVLRKTHMLSNASKQITAGLNKKRHGPFIILKKLSPLNYLLGDRDSKKSIGVTHISELKEYNERPQEWQPTQFGDRTERKSSDKIPVEPDDFRTRHHYELRPRP